VAPSTTAAASQKTTATGKGQTKAPAANPQDSGLPYTTIAAPVVEFGLHRMFSVGGAVTVGDLPVRSFLPVKRYQSSLAPADTVVTVIGLTQNDSYRIAPMLTLNWQFWQGHICRPIFTFGLSFWKGPGCPSSDVLTGASWVLGATVNKGSQTNVEYFGGLAPNWFDNRILAGVGYYAGQELVLAAGDSVGQRIPNTQQPPTTTKLRLRPAAQLGFRIYP
jgi:hypothetical protein